MDFTKVLLGYEKKKGKKKEKKNMKTTQTVLLPLQVSIKVNLFYAYIPYILIKRKQS
tara:strand:- start:16317 stop:16487 length:171 start_codon:yes stop_codon:yes gene_type:complete